MTGEVDELMDGVTNTCNPKDKEAVTKAASFLLFHQYIKLPFSQQCWRVKRGSGQGLNWSGAVADAAFLQACEKHGPAIRAWKENMALHSTVVLNMIS